MAALTFLFVSFASSCSPCSCCVCLSLINSKVCSASQSFLDFRRSKRERGSCCSVGVADKVCDNGANKLLWVGDVFDLCNGVLVVNANVPW